MRMRRFNGGGKEVPCDTRASWMAATADAVTADSMSRALPHGARGDADGEATRVKSTAERVH